MFLLCLFCVFCSAAEKQANETSTALQPCIVNYRATCSSHGECLALQNGTTVCFCDPNYTGALCQTPLLSSTTSATTVPALKTTFSVAATAMQSASGLPVYAIVLIVVLSLCVIGFIVGLLVCCCQLSDALGRR